MGFLGRREKETERAWEVYLGLGLKMPFLLVVVIPGGEGGGVIFGEEEETRLGPAHSDEGGGEEIGLGICWPVGKGPEGEGRGGLWGEGLG